MITPVQANIYKRTFAVIFDHLLITSILLVIYFKIISPNSARVSLDNNIFFLFTGFMFFYFIFFEAFFGWTIGKKIFKLQVVNTRGNKPSWSSVIVRNLFRPLDFTGFYLLGLIFVTYTANSQRIGDLLAHTMVVESLD